MVRRIQDKEGRCYISNSAEIKLSMDLPESKEIYDTYIYGYNICLYVAKLWNIQHSDLCSDFNPNTRRYEELYTVNTEDGSPSADCSDVVCRCSSTSSCTITWVWNSSNIPQRGPLTWRPVLPSSSSEHSPFPDFVFGKLSTTCWKMPSESHW